MIILKSIGGLGNQMFEIAFARYLSLEYNQKVIVDTSVYKKYKVRNFTLSNLYISEYYKTYDKLPLNFITRAFLKLTQKIYHIQQKLIRVTLHTEKIGSKLYNSYVKKGLYYNFDIYHYESSRINTKIKCLYGYFQSEEYFSKHKEIIKQDLKVKKEPSPKEKILLDEILSENALAVSMRLGDDYKQSKLLNVCTDEYYINGIQYILEKHPDATLYIFSDNIQRAKKLINSNFKAKYVEGFEDYESLRLMYSCNHFVIANSSFSWWGSYLSESPNKIIVAPDRWYNTSDETADIYTPNMIKLDV
ncbi:alpha-1,2-fucosyltransferase [Desemzia sp. RIT804]|uniref:alpha-1,2-fucosyltransferase n=1 Tax=Desemzia sp. RIT 804 TaxID=2810209 RepID=UPI00195249B5|nr:alpha-1,2-fucosyltransferase [Desemzia sp. RIT 804]MBM6615369.1 alpha-1,2-fucosyltransferase [Desemzia sp. RIT 804]